MAAYFAALETKSSAENATAIFSDDFPGLRVSSTTFNDSTNSLVLLLNDDLRGDNLVSTLEEIHYRSCRLLDEIRSDGEQSLNIMVVGGKGQELVYSNIFRHEDCI